MTQSFAMHIRYEILLSGRLIAGIRSFVGILAFRLLAVLLEDCVSHTLGMSWHSCMGFAILGDSVGFIWVSSENGLSAGIGSLVDPQVLHEVRAAVTRVFCDFDVFTESSPSTGPQDLRYLRQTEAR
jgi:hypothetical protein